MTKLAKGIGSMLKNAETSIVCRFLVTRVILSLTRILRTLATVLLLSGLSVAMKANVTIIFVSLPVLSRVTNAAMVLRTLRTCLVHRTVLSFGVTLFVLEVVPSGLV